MRSKIDVRSGRRAERRRSGRRAERRKYKELPGGKALQRMFAFLAERDPKLNDEIIGRMALLKAARPTFGLTKRGFAAKPRSRVAPGKRAGRAGETSAAAKSLAKGIAKAAAALTLRKGMVATAAAPAGGPAPAAGSWQFIGPTHIPNGQTYGTNRVDVIGRVSSIGVDPSDPKHVLVGAAGGGIWQSTDAGATWAPRTDQMPSLAIGAIAFDPTASNNVYAGSGEGNSEYAVLGAGVYKSTDGGTTWAVAGSALLTGVGFFDLVVDPASPSVLYGATTKGFYKSTNAGASWSLKRPGTCWDISVHPNGGSVELLIACDQGVLISTNSGNSFNQVSVPGAPAGDWARLAVDRVKSAPDVAYVFGAVGTEPYLWRRAGGAWTSIDSLPAVDPQQPWTGQAQYDWYVAASPDNQQQVYLGTIDLFRGTLTGSTWSFRNISTQGSNSIHPDQHCLAFSPDDSRIIYAGNDGGIFRSANSGANWTALNNGLGITEIEYLASDPNTSNWVMAGLQDNGTIRYTGSTKWEHIADGDGGDCGVNELNPNVVYHSYYDVSLERSDDKGKTWDDLEPPSLPSLFYPPVEVSGSTVVIGATSLLVTRTGRRPWTKVPLGLVPREVPSAMRTLDANTLLVGTNAGRVLKLVWSGSSWKRSQLASPASKYISCIAVDPSNPGRVWIANSQVTGAGGLIYRSDNGGTSWINCTAGLKNIPMNAVVVDPANFKRVWVAADVGVYQTVDLGATWTSFSNGLPNAMVADLLFHKQDRMLICGTRNRGAWRINVP
jgi:photosystem II stability/assembly factor-like uncharacterized protein